MRCSHLDGHRRRPRIAFAVRWSYFRCAAALSACTLPAYPRLENHPFAARGLLMSTQHCLVFVLGFQSWRVDSQGDKSPLFCVEAGSALCRRGGLASRSCPHFEKSSFNVNRTSMGTPVCCCRAKMCSKIGSSLSVHKTKFYRTFSSNQGKRKLSSTILSLLSARHALIH